MAGFWQLYRALTHIWRLKQSLLYLVGKLARVNLDCVELTGSYQGTSYLETPSIRP